MRSTPSQAASNVVENDAARPSIPDLNAALASAMESFRVSHPQQRAELAGHTWTYIASGSGAEAVLILPGLHGLADAAFRYITALEPHYRVVTPNYPAEIMTLAGMADGLAILLDLEGIEQAHVYGGSFGALVAQAFVRRHGERVLSVILEHPLFPRRRNGALILPLTVMARTLPEPVLRMLLNLGVTTFQRQIAHGREFWVAYFHRTIASFSRQDILARLSVLKDFYVHGRASLVRLQDWSGRALLVVAEADSLAPPRDCRYLLAHYAGAEVEVMSGSSHMGAVAEPERYIAVYTRFLGIGAEDQRTSA
ncbi:MAG TPA: alpha/beta hydrolase [Ktedonobacterales bacterium]